MRNTALLPLLLVVAACGKEEAKTASQPTPPAASTPAPPEPEMPPPVVETKSEPAPAAVPERNETPKPMAPGDVERTGGPIVGSLPGALIPAFEAKVRRTSDKATTEATLDSRATKSATVYIVESIECSFCNEYAARMKALEAKFAAKAVDFVHVLPSRDEPDEAKIAWHAEKGYAGSLLLDKDAAVAKLLTTDHTPTVYVVGASGVIAYRGALDDDATGDEVTQQYAVDAIDAVLAGKPVAVPSTEPPG
jgi:protein-disulfide isomerase